jgi:hypothetical protein
MRADIEMLKQEKAKQSTVFQNRKGQFGKLLDMVNELKTSISSERESTVSYKNLSSFGNLVFNWRFDVEWDEKYRSQHGGASTPAAIPEPADVEMEEKDKNASSHRFSERDDDGDEEGMVEDGEEGAWIFPLDDTSDGSRLFCCFYS